MKTYVATPTDRERNWLLVDANGQTLGRLATQIADALRGKRKPTYTPHVDTGDFVIVVNAEKISVTGNKLADKRYYRHSGYPGGLKSRTLEEMLERRPEEVIRLAVKGMLPRNRLARKQLTKLKVYAGPEHPHAAQQPQPMEIRAVSRAAETTPEDEQRARRGGAGRRGPTSAPRRGGRPSPQAESRAAEAPEPRPPSRGAAPSRGAGGRGAGRGRGARRRARAPRSRAAEAAAEASRPQEPAPPRRPPRSPRAEAPRRRAPRRGAAAAEPVAAEPARSRTTSRRSSSRRVSSPRSPAPT